MYCKLWTLCCFSGLNTQLRKEVQEFVKTMYAQGQTVLQSREHSEHDKSERRHPLQPFSLTICSNVACIELLLWAIKEDSGMFKIIETAIISRLLAAPLNWIPFFIFSFFCRFLHHRGRKFMQSTDGEDQHNPRAQVADSTSPFTNGSYQGMLHPHFLDQRSIFFATCWVQYWGKNSIDFLLQTLGKLAEKFPILASSIVGSLRDFLVNPSPILNKLNKYSHHGADRANKVPSFSITVTDESNPLSEVSGGRRGPRSKMAAIFENLRDMAIENICRYSRQA